jgi:hypothetical protein
MAQPQVHLELQLPELPECFRAPTVKIKAPSVVYLEKHSESFKTRPWMLASVSRETKLEDDIASLGDKISQAETSSMHRSVYTLILKKLVEELAWADLEVQEPSIQRHPIPDHNPF